MQEDVGERHHHRLLLHHPGQPAERARLGVGPEHRLQRRGHAGQPLLGHGRAPGDVVGEPGGMQVASGSASMVLIAASPKAPPRLRVRLNSPEAFLIRSGGSVPSASTLIGIMQNISATPRSACGRNSSPNAQSPVMLGQVEARDREADAARRRSAAAGRSCRARSPTTGAARNMKTPVTNTVSPIWSDDVAAHPRQEQRIEVGEPVEPDRRARRSGASRPRSCGRGRRAGRRSASSRSAPARRTPRRRARRATASRRIAAVLRTSRSSAPPRARTRGCRGRPPCSASPTKSKRRSSAQSGSSKSTRVQASAVADDARDRR